MSAPPLLAHCASPPSRRLRASLRLLAAALPLLAAGAAAALEPGEKAPIFTAPTLSGESKVSLGAHRGKVVYLDFWASWCGPCVTAVPMLDALREEFPADAFQVIGVNVDRDPEQARRFLERHPVRYPSASDPGGRIPESFDIETMPTSFLIDRNGVVRYVHRGFRKGDIDALRERIAKLLKARP